MSEIIASLQELESSGERELAEVSNEQQLDAWRVRYLGRRGLLSQAMRGLGKLPPDERPSVGSIANRIKGRLTSRLEEAQSALRERALQLRLEESAIDVTLQPPSLLRGQTHIVHQTMRQIVDAFIPLGFQVAEGPEVELDYYNFEALNIPKDHPARDMWDTFWVEDQRRSGEILLRTHTSPVQVRVMEQTTPPIRVLVPGMCYRYEAVDATHESVFYQVEGLAVDRGITMAELKGTLVSFTHSVFGQDRKTRFRCDYFPFVEPGVELSIDCHGCAGSGCRLCKQTGWIEILGAGMVHPNVLKAVGYDPETYTGFAFGMGPERIAMLKHGIDDIRLFKSNDLRFLQQFAPGVV